MLGSNLDTLWAARRGVPALPDPGQLLEPLRPLVSGAAIVLFNIEGAIGDGPAPAKCREGARNCYAFRQPVGIAQALRAFAEPAEMVGNVANNHSMDAGETGFRETLRYLAEAAVHTIGADTLPTIVVSGADSVAFLGFAATRAGPDPRDLAAVRRHVSRAKALTPRVIVSVHMGAEGTKAQRTRDVIESHLGENRGNPIAFAHAAVDAGASVVIGHGPHVLRGAEWYRGSLVLYSLGNLLTYGVFSLAEPLNRGAIACVVLAPDGGIAQASLHPTRQVPPGIAAPDASGRAAVLIDSLGQLDFPDSGARVRGDSLLLPGVMGGPERGGHVRRDGRLQGRP